MHDIYMSFKGHNVCELLLQDQLGERVHRDDPHLGSRVVVDLCCDTQGVQRTESQPTVASIHLLQTGRHGAIA